VYIIVETDNLVSIFGNKHLRHLQNILKMLTLLWHVKHI